MLDTGTLGHDTYYVSDPLTEYKYFVRLKNHIFVDLAIKDLRKMKRRKEAELKNKQRRSLRIILICVFFVKVTIYHACLLTYIFLSPYPCLKIGQYPRVLDFQIFRVWHSICVVSHTSYLSPSSIIILIIMLICPCLGFTSWARHKEIIVHWQFA